MTTTTNGKIPPEATAKALGHPLRATLLQLLADGDGTSPNELSKKLDEPLPNVSYHVRQLYDLGLLELVDTQPRRGAIEHYYRAKVKNARVEYDPA